MKLSIVIVPALKCLRYEYAQQPGKSLASVCTGAGPAAAIGGRAMETFAATAVAAVRNWRRRMPLVMQSSRRLTLARTLFRLRRVRFDAPGACSPENRYCS